MDANKGRIMVSATIKQSLSEKIALVELGENGDQAWGRLYGDQCRPCNFRNWYAAINSGDTSRVPAEVVESIQVLIEEGLHVDEAFHAYAPDYVTPGQFYVAFDNEIQRRKKQAVHDVVPADQDAVITEADHSSET